MQPNIIDLYHSDNAEKLPDFPSIMRQGIFAMVHKVSQGTTYRDPKFSDRVKAAQDAGMLVGAYHFLTAEDAVTQANLFLDTIEPFSSGNLAVFVDYEKSKSTPALHQTMTFMQVVENNIANCLCGIYSGDLIRETLPPVIQATGHITASMQTIYAFFASRRLWLAEYGPHERIPWPWSEHPEFCDMWQFDDRGALEHVIGKVDFSVFTVPDSMTATQKELAAIWKSGRPQSSRAAAGAIISSRTNRGEMRA